MPDNLKEKMIERVAAMAEDLHKAGASEEDALDDAVASVMSGVGYHMDDAAKDDSVAELFVDLFDGAEKKLGWKTGESGASERK